MSIKVNAKSIKISPGNISTGEIWFEYENIAFPEKHWNDFIDVILNWWIEAIVDFMTTKKNHCTLLFMDGAFQIEVFRRGSSQTLDLQLVQRHLNSQEFTKVLVTEKELIKSLKMSVNEVLRHLNKYNLTSSEFEKLKSNFKQLQQL